MPDIDQYVDRKCPLPTEYLETQVARLLGIKRAYFAQTNRFIAQMLKQSYAVAEKNRRDAQIQFVDETGSQSLLGGAGPTNADVFVLCQRLCFGNRRFDAVSHEDEL